MAGHTFLGISGSLRRDSFNRKLIREAARLYGADRYIEADLDLPLFNEDIEDATGIPASVQTLADQIAGADAVVISACEYNKSISGVLKNALDWVSRVEGSPWKGKPVALMSAAAGRAGGARANYALRLAMTPFRTQLLQSEVLVAGAAKEFDAEGRLLAERSLKALADQMAELRAAAGLPPAA